MRADANDRPIKVFSTCPASNLAQPDSYLRQMIDVARWSEAYRTFIFDVPASPEGLAHIRVAFERATSRVAA